MLGVLGGGPSARSIVMAARTIGYRTTVVDPDPDSPTGKVADVHLIAACDDPDAIEHLATTCAVVTFGADPVPKGELLHLAERTLVHPSPDTVAVCHDRIAQKRFLDALGVPVGPWRAITSHDDLQAARDTTFPALLMPAHSGHEDTAPLVCDRHDDAEVAWRRLGEIPCVLEPRLHVDRELSVAVARTHDGRVACYPVSEHRRVNGLLDTTSVPSSLAADDQAQAAELCTYLAEQLDHVGVLTVSMIIVGNDVYLSDLLPAPGAAGVYSLDACATDQFEQHVRAVCSLGLGDPSLLVVSASVVSLLGELWVLGEPNWAAALQHVGAHLHLYSTSDTRAGRSMGHLTVTSTDPHEVGNLARRLRQQAAATHQR